MPLRVEEADPMEKADVRNSMPSKWTTAML